MAYVSSLTADVTNKKPGDPIRSADWNQLGAEVLAVGQEVSSLQQGVADLNNLMGAQVSGLRQENAALLQRVDLATAQLARSRFTGAVDGDLRVSGALAVDGATTLRQGLELTGGAISFGKRTGQHINLYGTSYGLGIQGSTVYFRSELNFAWHQNGNHVDGVADPGGGANLMTLTAKDGLTVLHGIRVNEPGKGQARLYLNSSAPHAARIDFAQDEKIRWTVLSDFDQSRESSTFEIVRNNSRDERLFALDTSGNVTITGRINQYSDARIKDDPVPVDPSQSLQRLLGLTVYEYSFRPEYKADERDIKQRGFLAQEVKQVIPSAVTINGDYTLRNGQVIDNIHTVAHDSIFTEAVGAIQALHQRLQAQEARIQQLVAQLTAAGMA